MISLWALPGPARALAGIATRIAMGEHVILCGLKDFDARHELEPLLASYQRALRPVFDDPAFSPASVLWREHTYWHAPGAPDPTAADLTRSLGRDTWWIEHIQPERAAAWSRFLPTFANSLRILDPGMRPTIILCLPPSAEMPVGLTISERVTVDLTRTDLEVAAHYATAGFPEGLIRALRVVLAVEIAARELPRYEALETLYDWINAPEEVLTSPAALAARMQVPICEEDASLLLWRVQVGPVIRAIDRARCKIVRSEASKWVLPYCRPPDHQYPATIYTAERLELTDMIDQVERSQLIPRHILLWLRDFRRARNRLSHLEPIGDAMLSMLVRGLPL